jgi:hypothetical protein
VATTESPKMSPHSAKPRFDVRIIAPFSYRAFDELEEEITAAGRDGEIADLVDDEQREAAVVADPLAKSAVAFGLGKCGDDVGERAEVDAAAGFDRLDAEGEAQMSLAGPGRDSDMAPAFWRVKRRSTTPFIRWLAGRWRQADGASCSGAKRILRSALRTAR